MRRRQSKEIKEGKKKNDAIGVEKNREGNGTEEKKKLKGEEKVRKCEETNRKVGKVS